MDWMGKNLITCSRGTLYGYSHYFSYLQEQQQLVQGIHLWGYSAERDPESMVSVIDVEMYMCKVVNTLFIIYLFISNQFKGENLRFVFSDFGQIQSMIWILFFYLNGSRIQIRALKCLDVTLISSLVKKSVRQDLGLSHKSSMTAR